MRPVKRTEMITVSKKSGMTSVSKMTGMISVYANTSHDYDSFYHNHVKYLYKDILYFILTWLKANFRAHYPS